MAPDAERAIVRRAQSEHVEIEPVRSGETYLIGPGRFLSTHSTKHHKPLGEVFSSQIEPHEVDALAEHGAVVSSRLPVSGVQSGRIASPGQCTDYPPTDIVDGEPNL